MLSGIRAFPAAGAVTAAALMLCSCGDSSPAPPAPGVGAVGTVAVDNAGAAENPVTPALSGGPAGQTPDYPAPGAAPSVVYSQRDGAGPSVGNDN